MIVRLVRLELELAQRFNNILNNTQNKINMNFKSLVAQLANRINQPHVIETYMRKVFASGVEWQKKQSPWISVKDKLPEPEQEVFLYDRDSVKHYAIGWLRKKKGYCKSKWFVTNGYVTDESITHWMPIPKFNV